MSLRRLSPPILPNRSMHVLLRLKVPSVYVKPEDKYTFEPVDSDEESDLEDPVRIHSYF